MIDWSEEKLRSTQTTFAYTFSYKLHKDYRRCAVTSLAPEHLLCLSPKLSVPQQLPLAPLFPLSPHSFPPSLHVVMAGLYFSTLSSLPFSASPTLLIPTTILVKKIEVMVKQE